MFRKKINDFCDEPLNMSFGELLMASGTAYFVAIGIIMLFCALYFS